MTGRTRCLLRGGGLVLAPAAALHAQTTEIQERIETRLWFQRLLQKLGAAGAPPGLLLVALAAVALALVGAWWVWKSRRKTDA